MSHSVDLPSSDPPRRGALEAEDGRSLGDVMGDLTRNVSTLLQQEVALAKAELSQSGKRAGKGIGLYAGAAIAGILFLVFLSVSAWWGLGQFIGNEWSALVVAAVWVIVAIILALAGKKEMERIRGIPQTTETLGKVPNALKGHEEENL
jgi:tetrahydromethanopterin S-methyltransferase subunit G